MEEKSSSKAIKAGLWYTTSNILVRAVSVFTAPLFTRLLTPEDYGLFNNFFSWQTILACFFGLGLNYSIARAKIDYKSDFNGFISSIQTLSATVGIIILLLALPILDVISSFTEINKGLLISLMVLLIFSPSLEYLQSKYRFEYRYKENVIIAILHTIGVVALSVTLILLSAPSTKYAARIYGGIIPTFLIALFAFIYLYVKGKKFVNIRYWKYALRLSLPMIPHGLAMVLLAQIDRIMLLKMSGESAAGLYSFGYSYAIILSVVTNAIANAWQPWAYENLAVGQYKNILSSNRIINFFAFVATITFITLGPEVIMILGSPAFHDAIWMVPPVIVGCLFQFYYAYFSLMEVYCKRTELIAIGSVMAALIKIGLNFLFIPHFGYIGAAYSTMLGYAILLSYHWMVYRHIFKHKIFAEKQLLMLSVCSVLLAFLLTQAYQTIVLRYSILVVFLLVCAIRYKMTLRRYVGVLKETKYVKQIKCRYEAFRK
jgi:O-antigen/teichoic acid export membrane protein